MQWFEPSRPRHRRDGIKMSKDFCENAKSEGSKAKSFMELTTCLRSRRYRGFSYYGILSSSVASLDKVRRRMGTYIKLNKIKKEGQSMSMLALRTAAANPPNFFLRSEKGREVDDECDLADIALPLESQSRENQQQANVKLMTMVVRASVDVSRRVSVWRKKMDKIEKKARKKKRKARAKDEELLKKVKRAREMLVNKRPASPLEDDVVTSPKKSRKANKAPPQASPANPYKNLPSPPKRVVAPNPPARPPPPPLPPPAPKMSPMQVNVSPTFIENHAASTLLPGLNVQQNMLPALESTCVSLQLEAAGRYTAIVVTYPTDNLRAVSKQIVGLRKERFYEVIHIVVDTPNASTSEKTELHNSIGDHR